ncbi:XdhC family protein [Microbacterium sp. G2-8]|uniref:XdhC family protein n=1 Tax=Microbacterium sp. G2-8 TaxID=2842454 RepID=UPI001C8A89CD|nr:XdhC/CoxI family protein [Microbacterium sp. G2-8]
MLDLACSVLDRIDGGERVAVVTVTRVARSAPRGVGASMAITARGEVIGSLSGGCVEGDAVALAHCVLADGAARTARFGFDDDTAHAAGLACGGLVDVIAYEAHASDALRTAAGGGAVTIGIDLDTGSVVDHPALASAALLRETRVIEVDEPSDPGAPRPEPRRMRPDADDLRGSAPLSPNDQRPATPRRILAISCAPKPRLILLGATEHAAALCRVGSAAGYAVTVCDPWAVLATRERFPDADDLVVDMPQDLLARAEVDARTAIVVLTHDTRLDVPALAQALALPVGFVGALGARRTVARRAELLREAGVPDSDLARLHSPLGLDLGGSSPEATAVSAMAEILATRCGGSGAPLRELDGPIHRDRVVVEPAGRDDAPTAAADPPHVPSAPRDTARRHDPATAPEPRETAWT